jgi:hypothetical protein
MVSEDVYSVGIRFKSGRTATKRMILSEGLMGEILCHILWHCLATDR